MAGFAVPAVDPSALPAASSAPPADPGHPGPGDHHHLRPRPGPRLPAPQRPPGRQPARAVRRHPAGRPGPGGGRAAVRGPRRRAGAAGRQGRDARPGTEGGASLAELREVVLDLPGLPQTAAQLRAIGDWRATLPLPVPSDEVRWRSATVGGAEALSFADRTGRLNALLWQRDGHIWGGQRARVRRGPRCRGQPPLTRRRPPGPQRRSRRSPRPAAQGLRVPGRPPRPDPAVEPGRCSGSSAPTAPARRPP